ncbi:MAG: NADH-quinone oxidoreductase subunit NuoK [Symbiobacterium sp.]|uniref:NADH-quinone oxidoreductase subunit NuoK n=1 Tax=Symbiobacterium sp. TaxID=1971213 RepID=UPI003463F4F0
MPAFSLNAYVALSAVLFALGGIGVLVRRSPLAMLMSIELMLNSANLLFVAFGRAHGGYEGQIMAFLVITVAAAEVAIGLALTVLLFRRREHADVDEVTDLKL